MQPRGNRMIFNEFDQTEASMPAEAPISEAADLREKVRERAAEVGFLAAEAAADPIHSSSREEQLRDCLAGLGVLHGQLTNVIEFEDAFKRGVNNILDEG